MDDLARCHGDGCPWRGGCLRHRRVAYGRYNTLSSSPWRAERGSCDLYIPLPEPDHAQIRDRAWHLWQAQGRPQGRDLDLWLQAERELRGDLQSNLKPL